VVVAPGREVPRDWADAPRVVVGDGALADPAPVADTLHLHWLERRPVVIELAVPAEELRAPEVDPRQPWQVGDRFEFARERLHFLVWANTWDARGATPVWWWGRKAARLGAAVGGPADVVLRDGTAAYVDGGPRGHVHPVDVVSSESVDAGSLRVARYQPPRAELAADQLAAVAHAGAAARVIAPAGSGKTRVLTERLRHLLADRGWEAEGVTAVAFNKRAADELVARTEGLGAQVRTINALGLAVVRSRRRVEVLDEHAVRRILETLLTLRPQANTDVLAPYLEGLSAIRIGLRDPVEVAADLPDAEGLVELWPRYRAALDAAGAIDFDDQVTEAIHVLMTDPGARTAAQRRCRHLLVDEFQDLAPAHLLLLRLLSAPAYDVFGVGDDDQVIYGYAGATPSYLIEFDRWFPGAGSHALEVNYRCPARVVEGARRLLDHNVRRIAKTVRVPEGTRPGRLDTAAVPSEAMAAEAVRVVTTELGQGRSAGDMAVLTRVNSSLLPVQIALAQAGVATNCPLDRRVLDRTGVRSALAWLRVGVAPGSIARADLLETIRRPSRRVSRNIVDMLTRRSRTSVAEVRRLADRLSGGDVAKLCDYADDIDGVGQAARRDTAAALRAIGTTVGLGDALDTLDQSRSEADRSSHGDDLRALQQVAALHPDAATFGVWLAAALERQPSEADVVTLSTVHRVKGQEWPVVVVFGADADAFPHRLATDVEEERRVFHVAVTRASEAVTVIADAGGPSPFVDELTGAAGAGSPARARRARRGADGGGTDRAGGRGAGPGGRAGSGGRRAGADGDAGARRADGRGGRGGRRAGRAGAEATATGLAAARDALDPPGWETLRAWRRDAAARAGVPAFVVLSDADLRAVGSRRPRTMAELARCRGFGPAKLERYGDEVLAVLEQLPYPG
jgi:DNA helicase-2/ATP-dependent DNA helicase PcrA